MALSLREAEEIPTLFVAGFDTSGCRHSQRPRLKEFGRSPSLTRTKRSLYGQVAQSVEQGFEEPRVGSSNLSLATKTMKNKEVYNAVVSYVKKERDRLWPLALEMRRKLGTEMGDELVKATKKWIKSNIKRVRLNIKIAEQKGV